MDDRIATVSHNEPTAVVPYAHAFDSQSNHDAICIGPPSAAVLEKALLVEDDETLGDESIHVARAGSNANIDVVFLRHDGVVIEVAMNINDPCQASRTDQLARASAQRLDKAQL